MKIKISAVIEVHEAYGDMEDFDSMEWFADIMRDDETSVIVHSNEIGDEIGNTNEFTYEIITDNG